jgi:hypothetical protein
MDERDIEEEGKKRKRKGWGREIKILFLERPLGKWTVKIVNLLLKCDTFKVELFWPSFWRFSFSKKRQKKVVGIHLTIHC